MILCKASFRSLLAIVIATGAMLTTAGCFSGEPKVEGAIAEIPNVTAVKIDQPQDQLIAAAKRNYHAGLYSMAQEAFESLRDGFSPGPYSEFAEIKIADIQFDQRQYAEAAAAYELFVKNHPGSQTSAYALFRLGRSYSAMNKGIGRDVGPLEKARDSYLKLIEQYPNTVYVASARQELAQVMEKLGAYEEMVQQFYQNRANAQASAARDSELKTALKPKIDEAARNARESERQSLAMRARLYSRPETAAPAAVAISADQHSASAPGSSARFESLAPARGGVAGNQQRASAQDQQPLIQNVECDRSAPTKLFVHLTGLPDRQKLRLEDVLKPTDGTARMQLPATARKDLALSCFGADDVQVSRSGLVTIQTGTPLAVMVLNNPPRVLIAQ